MRKPILILLGVFFAFSLRTKAEEVMTEWVRRYNGPGSYWDRALAMVVDNLGSVFVTGSSYGIYATLRYYPDGRVAWVEYYLGRESQMDYAYDITLDNSGNVYVTGTAGTIKYDINGNQKWIGSLGGKAIAVDDSENVYVASGSSVLKYYPNGDTAWVRNLISQWDHYYAFNDITVDHFGNAYATGYHYYRVNNFESYIWCATVKYDRDGNLCWRREPSNTMGSSIASDGSDNVYVTGGTWVNGNGWDFWTIKYYPNGSTVWSRTYNGTGGSYDFPSAVEVDKYSNVYVTGRSDGVGSLADYVTIKYYPYGDTAWVRRYNGSANSGDVANAITVDSCGNVYVTGYSWGAGTDYDYLTVKYHPNGDTAWTARYNGLGDSSDYANSIAVDDSGNVYVSGYSYGITTYDDYAILKYVQYLRGDSNGDRKISVIDVVFLISYLLKDGSAPIPIQSGDVNCDGEVTISDVVYLISYLFKRGPAPEC